VAATASARDRGPSAADRATLLRLFRADGMLTILTDYYVERGFSRVGEPETLRDEAVDYCWSGNRDCYDGFQIIQRLRNGAGEAVTVEATAHIARFMEHAFLWDRYFGATVHPLRFAGIGGDRELSVLQTSMDMWIRHAGLSTPGADSGSSRGGQSYFFVRRLRCVDGPRSACTATFANHASYAFERSAVTDLVRAMAQSITPVASPEGLVYDSPFVDCGPYQESQPGQRNCSLLGQ
jgi:hypothetical protein